MAAWHRVSGILLVILLEKKEAAQHRENPREDHTKNSDSEDPTCVPMKLVVFGRSESCNGSQRGNHCTNKMTTQNHRED